MFVTRLLKLIILSSVFIINHAYAEILICENTPGAYILNLDKETGELEVKYFTDKVYFNGYFKSLNRVEKIKNQINETNDSNRIKELKSRLEFANKGVKRYLDASLLDEVIVNPEVTENNFTFRLEDGSGFLVYANATVLWFNNSTLKLNTGTEPSLSIKPDLQSEEKYNCKTTLP